MALLSVEVYLKRTVPVIFVVANCFFLMKIITAYRCLMDMASYHFKKMTMILIFKNLFWMINNIQQNGAAR